MVVPGSRNYCVFADHEPRAGVIPPEGCKFPRSLVLVAEVVQGALDLGAYQ